MRTASGVQGTVDGTDTGCFAGGRIFVGFVLAVIGSVAFMAGSVEVGQASPVQLVSYSPAKDLPGLSLKESFAVAVRDSHDSLPSRYDDNTSKSVQMIIPMPPVKPVLKTGDFIKAVASQAACETGGMFDACPGFMTLLEAKQKAWPGFPDLALPAARNSDVRVASLGEDLSLLAGERVTAPVDKISLRAGEVIMGAASTYNPYDVDDSDAGGAETASGELYNPIAWTAAIQTDLRGKFAGVRYGRLYKPSFALVELNGQRAIVKINDVGPLRPGRVIDLSQQVMRYFDPSFQRGVLDGVLVTPLVGTNWTPGPLGTTPAVAVARNVQ